MQTHWHHELSFAGDDLTFLLSREVEYSSCVAEPEFDWKLVIENATPATTPDDSFNTYSLPSEDVPSTFDEAVSGASVNSSPFPGTLGVLAHPDPTLSGLDDPSIHSATQPFLHPTHYGNYYSTTPSSDPWQNPSLLFTSSPTTLSDSSYPTLETFSNPSPPPHVTLPEPSPIEPSVVVGPCHKRARSAPCPSSSAKSNSVPFERSTRSSRTRSYTEYKEDDDDEYSISDDGDDFDDDEDDESLPRKRRATSHLESSATFPCQVTGCSEVFTRRYDSQRHFELIHSPNGNKFQCPYCSSALSRKDGLRRHLLNAHSSISRTKVDNIIKEVDDRKKKGSA